ncbi:MAG TPA: HlyD family efflux transporter periplasmic adaptor subunit [Rhodocyclaceae bacterium]|nr:HlyD family efflux transporter periplasmic adaptor subunit [Rhodocyclaceae bacterium]
MKNMVLLRRRIAGGLLAGLLAWGLYSGFRPQAMAVDVGVASRGPLRVTIEQEGRTRVVDRYVITAPVAAYARRIELDVGDAVKRGAPLVQLEAQRAEVLDVRRRSEAQARVEAARDNVGAVEQRQQAAQAGAELAQKNLQRVRELKAQGHITLDAEDRARADAERADAELRSAQFAVATARHDFEAARTALRFAAAGGSAAPVVVSAPVAGRVLKIPRKSEGAVAAGQALLEIGSPGELEVEVDVLSADAVRIEPGSRVVFERWGGEQPLEGVVRVVEPAGFTKVSALGVEEQRVWVIVALTSPRELWQRLGDGYRVEASFILWEHPDVLQIPASSLFHESGGWAVFVVSDGKALKRRVEIGQKSGLAAQVLAGVAAGEPVVVHPDDRLQDGVRVATR